MAPGRSPSFCRAAGEAANRPPASAVQNRWSDAVRSGVQARNWLGRTPITLTARFPALISPPSNPITCRTPVSFLIFAMAAGLSPCGATTSRSGRMIWLTGAASVAPAGSFAGRPMRGNTTDDGRHGGWPVRGGQRLAAVAAPAGTAVSIAPAPMASPSPASAAPRSSLAAVAVGSGPGRGRLLIAQPR